MLQTNLWKRFSGLIKKWDWFKALITSLLASPTKKGLRERVTIIPLISTHLGFMVWLILNDLCQWRGEMDKCHLAVVIYAVFWWGDRSWCVRTTGLGVLIMAFAALRSRTPPAWRACGSEGCAGPGMASMCLLVATLQVGDQPGKVLQYHLKGSMLFNIFLHCQVFSYHRQGWRPSSGGENEKQIERDHLAPHTVFNLVVRGQLLSTTKVLLHLQGVTLWDNLCNISHKSFSSEPQTTPWR